MSEPILIGLFLLMAVLCQFVAFVEYMANKRLKREKDEAQAKAELLAYSQALLCLNLFSVWGGWRMGNSTTGMKVLKLTTPHGDWLVEYSPQYEMLLSTIPAHPYLRTQGEYAALVVPPQSVLEDKLIKLVVDQAKGARGNAFGVTMYE